MITITISHTVPVFPDGSAEVASLADLWPSLVDKAENPVRYVPSITAAAVIERTADGFIREIVLRDRDRFRERVVLEPDRRVLFHQLDDPDLLLITNELGADPERGITYTLTVTLSPRGIERVQHEPGYLLGCDTVFFDTARGTVNSLRLLAARPAVPTG